MTKVSIIIVHYKVKKVLYNCLRSIANSSLSVPFEIVVVDNDEVKKVEKYLKTHFPKVKYIPAPENLGYGKGNNLGIKSAKGEYVFILNPDTIVTKGVVERMLDFIEKNNKVGAVAPSLYDESGKVYPSQGTGPLTPIEGVVALSFLNKIFPNNPISKAYWMKGVDRSKPYEADVLPGTAFLIRKDLFNKLGGFDRNFFLYFEESDLFKRARKAGYKLFILPKARLTHFWAVSTPPSDRIRKIFKESRFYYFKKNFGILAALVVEFFASISLINVLLFLIFTLGIFLRFYRLIPNLILNGEMGTDYMNIWNIIHGTRTWLIGPRTSHEWFFIPPISYWIYTALLFFGKYNPVIINIFWAIVGSSSILISYYYLKKLFNEKIALISSFLLAVSPAWIAMTRDSRYNAPAGIIFFPYLWYLLKSIKDEGKSLGILGLVLGFSMSFFPSPFLLVPAAIVCFIYYKIKPKLKYILYFFLGFMIPNITFLIYEVQNKFAITLQLLTWIPYRILGFFGLYHKNTVNSTVLSQNVYSIYQFIKDSFVPNSNPLSIIVFVLIITGTAFWLVKSLHNKDREMAFVLLIINLIVSYLGLFIHGDPPEHYYLVIFPIPLILAAYLLVKTFKNKFTLVFLTLLTGGLGIWNLISTNWFYQEKPTTEYTQSLPPYIIQVDAVSEILNDSKGSAFSISRIGLNDQFENNFANNYIYLLTFRGAKIESGAAVRYTIVEERNISKATPGHEIWTEGGIQIYKSLQ